MNTRTENTARQLYRETVVIDGLNVSNWDSSAVYQSLDAGGITALNATVATWEGYRETLDNIAAWLRRFREYDDILVQVTTIDEILQAKKDSKVGVILGSQNASIIENDLDRLALFHVLGLRIIQLTYNERNLLGNGCYERRDEGLSNFGLDAVREMNRLGILIDLSHVGDRTALEAIELSEKPVAITHANARSYFEHPRNKPDEVIQALAKKNGVIGAAAIASFLPTRFESTLDDYVNSIDDLVERIGIDNVAIGTDFTQDQPVPFWRYLLSQQGTKFPAPFMERPDESSSMDASIQYTQVRLYPSGLETPDEFPNLAEALMNRGYDPSDITKILGGNWLRLFRETWKH